MMPSQGGPPPAHAPAQAPTDAQQQQPQPQQQQQHNFQQQQQQQQQYYLQQQQLRHQQQHVAACQNATELQYQQYYQQQQQQQQQAAAATPPFNAQMAGAAAASAYYAPPPLPQPLGPASAGLPGMYQQQPSAGLQPQLMAALNACQHAAASSTAQQWPQNLQQAGSAPKQGRKPPGSRNQNIRTVVFKRGKDGLQGKSLAQSCTTFDTCYLFQRDMAKNGSNSISRVRAEPQPFI
jgi:hypothetical protein